MYLTIFLAALTLLSPAVNADDSCNEPPQVEAFASSLYTALFVTTDPKIRESLKLTGDEAALEFYKVIKKDLEGFGLCNARQLAFTGAYALETRDTVTLLDYFDLMSKSIANALYLSGVLNCDNDVPLSLDLFALIQKAFEGQDHSTFEGQFTAIIHGLNTFYTGIGISLGDVAQKTADDFRHRIEGSENCKADNSPK